MVLYHFNRYLLGLVSTYLCTYHPTEEFTIALANYVVSWGVRLTYQPDDIFLSTFYNRWHQLSVEFLYLCCHCLQCYATLNKTDIHLILHCYATLIKTDIHLILHCYATLIKTDIHLIAFDRLVYKEIQLIAVTLMTYSRARAAELRMITRDSYWNDKAPF